MFLITNIYKPGRVSCFEPAAASANTDQSDGRRQGRREWDAGQVQAADREQQSGFVGAHWSWHPTRSGHHWEEWTCWKSLLFHSVDKMIIKLYLFYQLDLHFTQNFIHV